MQGKNIQIQTAARVFPLRQFFVFLFHGKYLGSHPVMAGMLYQKIFVVHLVQLMILVAQSS